MIFFSRQIRTASVLLVLSAIFISHCSTGGKVVVVQSVPKVEEEQKIASRYRDPGINGIIHTAWDHYTNKRYEPALLDFERLIAKGYNHYDVLFGAGMSALKYYDLKKAIRYFSLCIDERPDHFDARYYRAETYRQLKQFDASRSDLEAILSIEPGFPLICGLYPGEYADKNALKRRREEAKGLLRTL